MPTCLHTCNDSQDAATRNASPRQLLPYPAPIDVEPIGEGRGIFMQFRGARARGCLHIQHLLRCEVKCIEGFGVRMQGIRRRHGVSTNVSVGAFLSSAP